MFRAYALITCLFAGLLCACVAVPVTTVKKTYVELPPASAPHLIPGDRIRVTLKDGKRYLLTVSTADAKKIQSVAGGSLPLDQIAKLEVQRYRETTELVWILVTIPLPANFYELSDFKFDEDYQWSLCISSPDVPKLAAARGLDASGLQTAALDSGASAMDFGGFISSLGKGFGALGGAVISGAGSVGSVGGVGSMSLLSLLLGLILARKRK